MEIYLVVVNLRNAKKNSIVDICSSYKKAEELIERTRKKGYDFSSYRIDKIELDDINMGLLEVMYKILVIPDIHSRKFWKETVSNNIDKVDKVIFLGDYVDPYSNEYQENPESMYDNPTECLQDIINLKKELKDKCILLLGNHIDHYLWTEFPESSRFNRLKEKEYINILNENLDLFNLVWVENDVIFSHAGITKEWADKVWKELKFPENEIPNIKKIAECLKDTPIKKCNSNYISLLGEIGYFRGGYSPTGSCEWADIREHFVDDYGNISPYKYEGIYQIFGHTQVKKPIITNTWACLDCRKGFIINSYTHEITEC